MRRAPHRKTWRAPLLAVALAFSASACHSPYRDPPLTDPDRSGEATPAEILAAPAEIPASLRRAGPEGAARRAGDVPLALPDPSHSCTLAELIDIALRNNPDTRIAWEQARQAALAAGIVDSSYLPQVSAALLGGVERVPTPVPKLLDPKGNIRADVDEITPSLVVEWLLFDFGRRDALSQSARNTAAAARIGFTGAHQKLIFDVSKAYYALDAERAQLEVAQSALDSAKILQEAAEARYARGLATITEVETSRRGTAKARFEIEQARTVDNDAYHALLEAMGLTPTLPITAASSAGRPLPRRLAEDADTLIRRALASRPDILAALQTVRAREADVAAARASNYPTVALVGQAAQNRAGLNINGQSYTRVDEPGFGVMLQMKMPLFDGGLRDRLSGVARSRRAAAEEELSRTEDAAIRQVARAHDTLNSALARHDAALAYERAADREWQSALDSYRNGVGTLTVAATAETERTSARSARARAYADVLTAAASLAFATGGLTSVESLDTAERFN